MGLIKDIKATQVLKKIYGEQAKSQLDRYARIEEKFQALFGNGEVLFFSTSGRSEIIGNHTDHNHGSGARRIGRPKTIRHRKFTQASSRCQRTVTAPSCGPERIRPAGSRESGKSSDPKP